MRIYYKRFLCKLTTLFVLIIISSCTSLSSEAMKSAILNKLNSLSTTSSMTSSGNMDKNDVHTLSITGTAMKYVETNLIKIGINVETLDKNLKKSYEDNSRVSNVVTGIFEEKGIPKQNITTTNYEITPEYEEIFVASNSSYVQVFKGYKVKNEMEVTLSKKKLAADLMDKVVLSGPVMITHVTFGYTDGYIKSIKDSLLEEAAGDASTRAGSIAKTLKVCIDDVKQVNLNDFSIPQGNRLSYQYEKGYVSTIEASLPPPTFYSGTSIVNMDVSVEFIISKA